MSPANLELAEFVGQFFADPLGFVLAAYPWGEAGTSLADEEGPDDNQREFLLSLGGEVRARGFDGTNPVSPIRMAETSGHGTGKSVLGAWLTDWILSTRPQSIGTVTAGNATQLKTRTWAAIRKWTALCITAHWWEVQSGGIYARPEILSPGQTPQNWCVTPQTCKAENAQNFAGQHARTSTSWFLFDEASTVPDAIYKVAYGGLSDGHPMFFAWGQPERNTGEFYNITFGEQRERWNVRTVDSRDSRMTNKPLIQEWIDDYGLDSDWVKVRVLGLPPSASELQYIDSARVDAAKSNTVEVLDDEPLIAGFDVSGGGKAWNVIRFRRGRDARPGPRVPAPIRITGELGRDRNVLVSKAALVLSETDPDRKVAMMFVDSAFGAAIVERLHSLGHRYVEEVVFGGASPDEHDLNMRAYMWRHVKEWLPKGAIDAKDVRLAVDLVGPGYAINQSSKLVIESKEAMSKRGVASPDDGDALALTFAAPVAPARKPRESRRGRSDEGNADL